MGLIVPFSLSPQGFLQCWSVPGSQSEEKLWELSVNEWGTGNSQSSLNMIIRAPWVLIPLQQWHPNQEMDLEPCTKWDVLGSFHHWKVKCWWNSTKWCQLLKNLAPKNSIYLKIHLKHPRISLAFPCRFLTFTHSWFWRYFHFTCNSQVKEVKPVEMCTSGSSWSP